MPGRNGLNFNKEGTTLSCYYNEGVFCENRNCAECGWNPVISERRLAAFLKRHGIHRKEQTVRLINAVDAMEHITASVLPMVEANRNPWRIYAEVMKCLNTAITVKPMDVTCAECCFSRKSVARSLAGFLICDNEKSPCNRRKVKSENYCPYGERSKDGKEDN